jgi:hypothetical protein
LRIHIGPIPESPDFSPAPPWKPLREPTPAVSQLCALPIGLVAFAAVGFLWHILTPFKLDQLNSVAPFLLLIILGIIPIHELAHLAVHPRSNLPNASGRSVLGFWPRQLLFYAHYEGELSRNRFIAILIMPTLVISILPLLAFAAAGRSSGLIALVSSLNALFACVDLFGIALLLFQVPSNAIVRNVGWRTFWKLPNS